jgi:hypothetical protein
MGVELNIPEPALHERAEHGIRETLDDIADAQKKVATIRKAVQHLGVDVIFGAPEEPSLRAQYANFDRAALEYFHIQTAPFASHPLEDIHRMAVARDFTFEDTRRGVVGLQDCVILLSVFHHLRASPASAAFVSNDSIFSRIPMLVPTGVELVHIPGLDGLEKTLNEILEPAFDVVLRKWWDDESFGIRQALEKDRDKVQQFLEASLDQSELETRSGGRLITGRNPIIENFGWIRPELRSASDERLRFSCDLKVSYEFTFERRLGWLASAFYNPAAQQPPQPEQVTECRELTVELAAQLNPDYTDLKLETACIRP